MYEILTQMHSFSMFTCLFWQNSWFRGDRETGIRFDDLARKEKHTTNLLEAFCVIPGAILKDQKPRKIGRSAWRSKFCQNLTIFEENLPECHFERAPTNN